MSEIWRLTAAELAKLVARRDISAREAAAAALARLEAVNPAINAVIAYRGADVLAAADAVDTAIARGENPGLLAGVPVTVKGNIDQRGFATTNGVRAQRHLMPENDSPVVKNLRAAGAVILGRTNMPAFSLRWFTSNLVHGATKNPWNAALTPGGSSGGAAAALACGIGHIAHGTDIAGSIRYPAYACGVHGLRPSLGRVAAYNASGPERGIGAQLSSVSGPLARTIADLRLGLAAMAGPDARDVWWVPAPLQGPEVPRVAALCLRPGGMRIAPAVAAALGDAARRLADAGWAVEELADMPPLREAADLQTRLWIGKDFTAWETMVAADGDPGAAAVLAGMPQLMRGLAPMELDEILVRRAAITRAWQICLSRYAVLLLPVSAELPFADDLDLTDFPRVWAAQLTLIGLALTGLPALTVATGLADGVPVGVQLVAARFREDLCLDAGAAIEAGGVPATPIDPVP